MNKVNNFDFWNYLEDIDGENWKVTYRKLFNKYNLLDSLVFSDVIIIETEQYFEKLGRKNFPKKPTKENIKVLSMNYFLNGITGILFFHDRVLSCYTKWGYIPYRLSCINPTKTTKVVRNFQYVEVEKIYNLGGYREKSILDNLKDYSINSNYTNTEHTIIEFFDNDNNSFLYDAKNNRIVG